MKKFIIVLVLMMFGVSNAALIDRGDGMIYDDVADLTWYDYSYAGTWDESMAWADGLIVAGFDDWRLSVTGDGALEWGYDGSTNRGYNITSSELGFLFYESLGNEGFFSKDGSVNSVYGLENTGPFENLMKDFYWSSTESSSSSVSAYAFDFVAGGQGLFLKGLSCLDDGSLFYGFAVRDGDVAPPSVPEPGTFMLLASGLLGLVSLRRREV